MMIRQQAIFTFAELFSIEGRGVVVTGNLSAGQMSPGMKLRDFPKSAEVISIVRDGKKVDILNVSEHASLQLSGLSLQDLEGVQELHFE